MTRSGQAQASRTGRLQCRPIPIGDWSIYEVGQRRHLVGRRFDTGAAHISSGIAAFDLARGQISSRSLARYSLLGLPGSHASTTAAWSEWLKGRDAGGFTDVTSLVFGEMIRAGYKPGSFRLSYLALARPLARIPTDFPSSPVGASGRSEGELQSLGDSIQLGPTRVLGEIGRLTQARAVADLVRQFCAVHALNTPRRRELRLGLLEAQFWHWTGAPFFLPVDEAKWAIRRACHYLRWQCPSTYLREAVVPQRADIGALFRKFGVRQTGSEVRHDLSD